MRHAHRPVCQKDLIARGTRGGILIRTTVWLKYTRSLRCQLVQKVHFSARGIIGSSSVCSGSSSFYALLCETNGSEFIKRPFHALAVPSSSNLSCSLQNLGLEELQAPDFQLPCRLLKSSLDLLSILARKIELLNQLRQLIRINLANNGVCIA